MKKLYQAWRAEINYYIHLGVAKPVTITVTTFQRGDFPLLDHRMTSSYSRLISVVCNDSTALLLIMSRLIF
jgi:hypothetical protein